MNSITSWARKANSNNLAAPITLDATASGWASEHSAFDLIIIVNLLHLISKVETTRLISEASQALNIQGTMLIYGPFMRGDRFESEGDERFHHSLVAQDSDIGYKSFESVQDLQTKAGLFTEATHEMPANNLMLVSIKQ